MIRILENFISVYELLNYQSSFSYKEFTVLKSHDEVEESKSGSCHDQVMYELQELRNIGINPKALFLMVIDENGQGYDTHSFVYYKNDDFYYWYENAWEQYRGIHKYKSFNEMLDDIKNNNPKEKKFIVLYPFILFYIALGIFAM